MDIDGTAAKHMAQLALQYALHLGYAIVVFTIGYYLSRALSAWVFQRIEKRRIDHTFALFARRATFTALMLLVVTATLSLLGIQSTSLVAIIGGISIAVGLSLRSSLSNLASGILLVFFRPFKVGDFIEIGSDSGTVQDIQILYTALKTEESEKIMIPNNLFLTRSIKNYSAHRTIKSDK